MERVEHTLALWRAKYLSLGGRVTLIKTALANLPIYFMSLFKCPVLVVDRIERLEGDFQWQGMHSSKKFHLVDWKSVCKAKEDGGLGFRPLKQMNEALLNK